MDFVVLLHLFLEKKVPELMEQSKSSLICVFVCAALAVYFYCLE